MKVKITACIVVIILIINNLSIGQISNPYSDFNPEKLKENKEYVKNFNPINYNRAVFYSCMIEMIDIARKQYAYVEPLKHDVMIDSTAQFQADFQALKNEKTESNEMLYGTLSKRLQKYGLSSSAIEIVAKAKTFNGIEEYSIYDLCMEIVKPLLTNSKTSVLFLDKKYTAIGLGFETDKDMKSMYVSIVLGDDRIFTAYKPKMGEKNLPYKKGKAGLKEFDAKICKKCLDDFSLEKLLSYITIEGEKVAFNCDNSKELKKMIGKEGDAFVLDFVQYVQYDCEKTIVDNSTAHRGFVTKPITFEKIMIANTTADPKSLIVSASIATVPEEVNIEEPYDVNIIFLKEGSVACRTIFKKSIEVKKVAFTEKVNFFKDINTVKNAGDWVAFAEEDHLEFQIPFTTGKNSFTIEDLDSIFTAQNVPAFKLQSFEIVAYNSLEQSKEQAALNIQKQRAESISKIVAQKFNIADPKNISYEDSWDLFQKELVNSSDYYDLVLYGKEEAIKRLKADKGKIAKEIEEYLVNQRYATVRMNIVYEIEGANELDFTVSKFNKAIADKNNALAMSIQKYMIKKAEKQLYKTFDPNKMQIPDNKNYQPFLMNKIYLAFCVKDSLSSQLSQEMKRYIAYNATNPTAVANNVVLNFYTNPLKTTADVTKLQSEIDRLYTISAIPKEEVDRINLEFQLKVILFIEKQPLTSEIDNLSNATFNKIKTLSQTKIANWENAYKIASYFVKRHDYAFAVSLMDPFMGNESISEDFLFSYISLASTNENMFMSSIYTKSVKMAAEKNPKRLCSLFDKLPISIFDNKEVKSTVCKICNR
ncbi:MAG: hypothetical protein LBU51_08500 [Bacteroidales bacterium]|jgi:hypothetical protein|nr:hypothetical protein [Bacteroidales bacterium]